ncbi:hypothetical protein A2851_01760 [Candidatus Kaiserbacteria bacterium RIFCSPHIGHO2_01_FULL_53_29]|uniref:Thioredoxin domain-containing protein n=2 Tax=Candidatus Kaiseribacteriota TaxID=1752734 RepID=A0A1F6CXV9_9BACT|nr:MAG: hypothetical protein A2851_01760 [Candidatus Kaiserbacteria bacterium RIFCSPHIGHO2_01_FULL_53_29]
MILLLISFVAGILTVLAPCVLPLLPVIVGGSLATGSRRRAYAICLALGVSIILFTLLLKVGTAFINVPQSFWQWFSGGILILFGVVMIFPRLWDSLPFVNKLNMSSNKLLATGYRQNSIWGDMLMGAALGPVFASCSPTYFVILATVLPASFLMGFVDLLAYAIGLSGFLLIIAIAGQKLVDRLGVTIEPGGWFRRSIGILFLVVGILVATGTMVRLEAWLLERGFDATKYEHVLLGAPMDTPLDRSATSTLTPEGKALVYPEAPELVLPDGYINTGGKPITIGEFKGKKVVLIDIWTYSCINCQRTLPYLKAWYEKYKNTGLEIIGVHTPEFAFEKLQKNVQTAVNGFGITYPVILDNEYRTWNAYGNQYWPRKYLVDIDGFIVYDHIGEGGYAETEMQIQKALAERAERLGLAMPDIAVSQDVAEAGGRVRSPETYFGAWRNSNLGNGISGTRGPQTLTMSSRLQPNEFYLDGRWNFEEQYLENLSKGARIAFTYDAKDVYFVAAATAAVKIKVTRDGGEPLGTDRGADVDANGEATIHEDRLYKLIEGADYGTHTLEIEVEGVGLQAYTFTFG